MKFTVERNDIARMEVDAVVLPANWRLAVGTGASLALFEAAGREELEAECAMKFKDAKRRGIRLVPGVSIPTHSYELPAQIILHTIVPKWSEEDPRACYEDLCKSYASALVTADEAGCESIAFPVLAAGNNGFDEDVAIEIAIQSLAHYEPKNKLARAVLVTFVGRITQKVRDRGYEVKEVIDQVHVLDQEMHQAEVVDNGGQPKKQGFLEKLREQRMIDQGIKWMQDPKHREVAFNLAKVIADFAIPQEGKGQLVHGALDAIAPLVRDEGNANKQ